MALIEVQRARRQSEEYVSIAGKYSRLLVFFKVYEQMKEKHGKDFNAIKFFVDDKIRDKFWMRPDSKEGGGLPIRLVGKNRILSVFNLLQLLNWKKAETVRLPVSWDPKTKMWMVDCRSELKQQRRARTQEEDA